MAALAGDSSTCCLKGLQFFVACCSYSKGFFFSERFVSFLPSASKNTANFNLA